MGGESGLWFADVGTIFRMLLFDLQTDAHKVAMGSVSRLENLVQFEIPPLSGHAALHVACWNALGLGG